MFGDRQSNAFSFLFWDEPEVEDSRHINFQASQNKQGSRSCAERHCHQALAKYPILLPTMEIINPGAAAPATPTVTPAPTPTSTPAVTPAPIPTPTYAAPAEEPTPATIAGATPTAAPEAAPAAAPVSAPAAAPKKPPSVAPGACNLPPNRVAQDIVICNSEGPSCVIIMT
jgi:hypothetical protein